MFIIPKIYQMKMDLETAEHILGGASGIASTMENVKEKWELHCSGHHFFEDDDEFFEVWQDEVNAFNVMYKAMKPLFVTV